MDNATEIIILAVSVIITAVVIVAGFSLLSASRAIPSTMVSQLNETNRNMEDYQYTKYQDITLTGSEALSAARRLWNKEATVTLDYWKDGEATHPKFDSSATPGTDLTTFQNVPTNLQFINPADEYTADVSRNPNGIINKISFNLIHHEPVIKIRSATSGETLPGHESGYVEDRDDYSAEDPSAIDAGESAVAGYEASADSEPVAETAQESVEDTGEDLDVIFSDEAEKKSTETEESAILKQFKSELAKLQDRFDKVDIKSLNSSSSEFVIQSKIDELCAIREDVASLQRDYTSKNLSVDNKQFVEKSSNSLFNSIARVISDLSTATTEEVVE